MTVRSTPENHAKHFCTAAGSAVTSSLRFVDDASDALLVELDRLGHVVEYAEVVDDQPVRLGLAVRPVRAADGLKQRVVPQRLVQVHRLQDGSVEAGQQLRRDDQDLQRVVRVTEAVEKPFFGVLVPAVGGVVVLAAVHGH